MLRFLLSIEEEELGDNVAVMTACSTGSTDENLLRTPSSTATPACSETLKRFNYYFFSAQGISDTEGEEKNWLENVNAGMTISPGGLRRLKTVVEQDSVESLNDNR